VVVVVAAIGLAAGVVAGVLASAGPAVAATAAPMIAAEMVARAIALPGPRADGEDFRLFPARWRPVVSRR
jgi:hypothetical protein